MQIAVTFRHMEADDGIKEYVNEKAKRLQKYVENPREVHVVLSAEKFRHVAEITVVTDGTALNSQGKDSDLYAAIDQMVDKIERQIKERRGKVRRKRISSPSSKTRPQEEENESEGEEVSKLPAFVQRRSSPAKPMSVEEAVAQLRITKKDVLIFINSNSGQMNALYRCKEGGYEWVEPETT